MPRFFLIGYMGSGKTTIGKRLAKKLGLAFIDVDLFIENRFRKSIGEIFKEYGENGFRNIEHKILEEVVGFEDTVISTGGGLPCFFNNMELMNQHGTTVYLRVSVDELTNRLETCKNNRPLIKDKGKDELHEFIAESLNKREIWYNKAKLVITAEKIFTPKDMETQIDDLIQQLKKQPIL
jgi:Shikimate kinase